VKMTIGVSRKAGRENYSSDQASAEVTIELDDSFSVDMVAQAAGLWHQSLTAAVDNQLVRMRLAPPAPAEAESIEFTPPAPRRPSAPEPQRPAPQEPYRRPSERTAGPAPRVPSSGRELLGWALRAGQDSALKTLVRAWNLEGRIVDLGESEIADLYAELSGRIAATNGNGRH
jgi:hypothetical protein